MPKPTVTITHDLNDTNTAVPSGAVQSDGYPNGARVPAGWLNYALKYLGEWTQWLDSMFDTSDEHQYPTPPTRVRVLNPLAFGGAIHSLATSTIPNWTMAFTGGVFVLAAGDDEQFLVCPISSVLPDGATLTRWRVFTAQAGATDPSAYLQNSLVFGGLSISGSAGTNQVTGEGSGAPSAETPGIIDSGVISVGMTKLGDLYDLIIQPGQAEDQIWAIELTYTDAGLRNV